MKSNVIETHQLTKRYGNFKALDGVNIHVKQGEIYGLVGDNGAGKSTLLKALAGLCFTDGGDITLLGASATRELEEARHRMGAMIEEPGFIPELTVEGNMEYYRRLKGVPGKEAVKDVLQTVKLWEKRKTKAKGLSMGMKKRLGIAIAMLGEPELLVLDEPINGLDPSGIVELRMLLQRLNEEKNMTILLSSHILSELQQTATTYGFLVQGQLLQEISAEELHEKCADYLLIKVTDMKKYAALLDMHCPGESYKVFPDESIHIFAPKQARERYSALAANNGIYITAMEWHQYSLEEYFMQLKKEAHHV